MRLAAACDEVADQPVRRSIAGIADGYRLDPSKVELDIDRLGDVLSAGGTPNPLGMATIDAILQRAMPR